MALPALQAAAHDVMVARTLAPILAMAGIDGEILPLDRGARGFIDAARRLRARRYYKGVLLPPSLSSALLFRAGGVTRLRGTDTDARGLLLTERIPVAPTAALHRAEHDWRILFGGPSTTPLAPRLTIPDDARDRWIALAGAWASGAIGFFPGSNASSRRWPVARFAELGQQLTSTGPTGTRIVVFGGPSETAMTAAIASAGGPRVLDLGGQTDLPTLAAGLAACALLVSNDSGPLHLAAAVGTRTLSLWGAGNPAITAPLGSRNTILRHAELGCVPCVKNSCPRSGPGFVGPQGYMECLDLITVADVETVVADAVR
jgi:heptosyltransferase-2